MSGDFEGFNELKRKSKENKRVKNRKAFDKLRFEIIKEVNNIVTFKSDNEVYYFTEINGKVRKKGSRDYISLQGFIKGNKIQSKKDNTFVELESYKHKCAKDILFNWLKEADKNEFCEVAQIKWRSNYGVFKELKFYTTSTSYYFETSEGLIKTGLDEIENPDDRFDKDFNRGSILFVPDITIFHKGMATIFIEIVNTNDVTKEKLQRMKNFADKHGYYPKIYKIKADDILNINVGNIPKVIKCDIIELP